MPLSVGLVYIATSIFGLCGALLCVSVIALVMRQQGPPPVKPFASPASRGLAVSVQAKPTPLSVIDASQLTGKGTPRDAGIVKVELTKVLKRVEELKAELTALDSLQQVLTTRSASPHKDLSKAKPTA